MAVGAYAPEPVGGSERQCALLTDALIARGHTVDVVTFRHEAQSPAGRIDGALTVHRLGRWGPHAFVFKRAVESMLARLPGVSPARARELGFWLGLPGVWLARAEFLRQLTRFATRNRARYDLVHVHESGWLAGACVARWGEQGVPVFCKEATAPALGPIGFDTPRRRQLDASRRNASAWIAQTDPVRDALVDSLGKECPVIVIPNAVAIPTLTSDPASERVLYVGNLSQGAQWKGFDVLFEAWVQVIDQRPDAKLTVVGVGDAAPWQAYLAGHAKASESVTFMGRLDDPYEAYLGAGVFVLPSRVEGMSNALLEAQSSGLACVVSDIPGNRAVVSHDVNGLTVPVGDAGALAEGMLRLLGDTDLRARLGHAAREHMEQRFGLARVVDQLTDLYRSLVEN